MAGKVEEPWEAGKLVDGMCKPHKPNSSGASYKTHKIKMISRFNFKGGVGKTTSTYSFAWNIAMSKKHRVLMVDADAQCNLTQLVLGRTVRQLVGESEDYARFFSHSMFDDHPKHLFDLLAPLMDPSQMLKPATVMNVPVVSCPDSLFLVPGNLLAYLIDEHLSRAVQETQLMFVAGLGMFYHSLWMTAAACGADVVVVDLPPSLGGLTRVAVMSSHYFMVPFQPDFFSWEALRALGSVLTGVIPNEQDTEEEPGGPDGPPSKRLRTRGDIEDQRIGPSQLELAHRRMRNLITQGGWFKWFQDRVERSKDCNYPLPDHMVLGDSSSMGVKFIGAQCTRFQSKFSGSDTDGVPHERDMVANVEYWMEQMHVALQAFLEGLPGEMRLSSELYDRLARPKNCKSLVLPRFKNPQLCVGIVEEMYQVAPSAQRASLPVIAMDKNTLYQAGMKTSLIQKSLERIQRANNDYQDLYLNLKRLGVFR